MDRIEKGKETKEVGAYAKKAREKSVMDVPATRQDVENLREDLRDYMGRQETWNANHSANDRMDFSEVRKSISSLEGSQSSWNGGMKSILWVMGIFLPAIFGAIVALYVHRP